MIKIIKYVYKNYNYHFETDEHGEADLLTKVPGGLETCLGRIILLIANYGAYIYIQHSDRYEAEWIFYSFQAPLKPSL
jgi:hypothetical protein